MAEDNEYLVMKLKEHRNSLRRRGQVHQALGISSVLKALKKFPLPVVSVKVAELIQGVGASYAELIGKWLAEKPQKRRTAEDLQPMKTTKLAYPPGSELGITLLCCMRAKSPFQEAELREVFADSVSRTFIGDFPEDVLSVLQTLQDYADIEPVEGGGFRLTLSGVKNARDLAGNGESLRLSTPSTQCEDPLPDPDSWFDEVSQAEESLEAAGEAVEITLYVDTAERLTDDFAYFATQLENRGVKVERQKLWIGDYHWVAKRSSGSVLSLGVIVERKAAQDLAASIVDGRYQAQKRRIRDANVQCIYLLEGTNPSKFQTISQDSIMNAVVNTMLKYGFQIKVTRNVHETINWLGRVSLALDAHVRSLSISHLENLIPFEELQDFTNPFRHATVQTIFGRQLRSIPACGAQATEAILGKFGTIRVLYDSLKQCKSQRAKKKLFKSVVLDTGSKLQKRIAESLLDLLANE